MIWTAIGALFGAVRLTETAADTVYNNRIHAQNESFERQYREFIHRVESFELEQRLKSEVKNGDFWSYLGVEPTAEEERVYKKAVCLRVNDAVLMLVMSEHGKLPFTKSIGGFNFYDHDPAVRRIAERCLLKVEENLKRNGVHTVICFKRTAGSCFETWYSLSDYVKIYGFGKTQYGDEFMWANTCSSTLRYL